MATDGLLIKAHLASPLAGEPPHLDSLLEWALSLYHGRRAGGRPGYKVDRALPAPPQAEIPIPIGRRSVTGEDGQVWEVARCSAPILATAHADEHEYTNKRIAVELAGLLDPAARTVVATTNSWTKSHRLPMRVRRIEVVAWFAVGNRKAVRRSLKKVQAIGKKPSVGYGRVREWTVERIDQDHSWFAPSEVGPVLMRPLPVGAALPEGLIGCRRDFGSAVPPYFHPDRYTEIWSPC